GVDDDQVVRLLRHLHQAGQLRLGDELRVLGPDRRGEDVEARGVARRVAGQLLGIELARSGDEILDRLLRLDPEHDRGVPELEVEVEQQGSLARCLGERGGEVRRHDGLARPALGREDGDHAAVAAWAAAPLAAAAGVARLADGKDDVLGQLREQQNVGDVCVECFLEQRGRLARGEEDDRGVRVLADRRDLVDGQRRAAGGMDDRLEVASRQRAGALTDLVGVTDELDLAVAPEGVVQLGQPFTAARDEDTTLLSGRCLGLDSHYRPPRARLRSRADSPSRATVLADSMRSGLSAASVTARSSSDHLPFCATHQSFSDCASVTASIVEKGWSGLLPSLLEIRLVSGACSTSRSRSTTRLTWVWPPSGSSQFPTKSTRSPSLRVPARSCCSLPAISNARRFPFSWARIPCSWAVRKRRVETCSPA